MQGQRLGSYEIIDKLGEGGMGEVWRGRDERLNRSVAVKILPADIAGDPSRRSRFEQEARALGALSHPNIVAVYDVGQDSGRSYIVSELVDGESLRAVIDRGPLPVRRVVDYAVQMADALAAAHELGIVHLDFKPENVMLTRAGRVKVLDFGLAKQSAAPTGDKTATIALTEPGVVMGTVGYMSPEQIRGEAVDARTDIFGFGCVLYEMITGRRVFRAGSSVDTMHSILHEDPPEFEAGASLPPALGAIARRCIEKRPDQRFQSAADFAFALRGIGGSGPSADHPQIAGPSISRRMWPALIAASAGALLFAAGYFSRLWTSHASRPQFQRITFRKGFINNARFTADGRNIIYLAVPGSPDSRAPSSDAGRQRLRLQLQPSIVGSLSGKGTAVGDLQAARNSWNAPREAASHIHDGGSIL
jgi:serine/threonine protein kinase